MAVKMLCPMTAPLTQITNMTRTHLKTGTSLYTRWAEMKYRCTKLNHRNYKDYGGRGITVCEKWMDFEGFAEDMELTFSPELSLDRIDNDGNYEKSNCRWATRKEQGKNRRTTILYDYNGGKKSLKELTRELRLPQTALFYHVRKLGWPLEKALSKLAPSKHV